MDKEFQPLVERCWARFLAAVVLCGCGAANAAGADQPATNYAKSEAPPNMAVVGSKLGGLFFAPKPLKEQYDTLIGKIRALEAEIVGGQITAQKAADQVGLLKSELAEVRQQVNRERTFVPTARIHQDSETTTFELGPEQSLLIVADNVRLIGWDQPGIKCILDKTVLTTDEQPVGPEFEGIQLAHRHGRASTEMVGFSTADVEAAEAKFLASPEGQKLDEQQRADWQKQFRKIFVVRGFFAPLQGKDIDLIEISGLTHQQGNRQISLESRSKTGNEVDGRVWSTWQRHAGLTVYVPACKVVGLRGGMAGLDVESVKASLLIEGDGNRDYEAIFRVQNHDGPLAIENVPVQRIEHVRGDVSVTVSADTANSGTRHGTDTVTCYSEPPEDWTYHDIAGNLTALFIRANLTASAVSGRVAVSNQFGNTILIAEKPLAAAAHRLLSESGGTEVQLAKDSLQNLPLIALTECGSVSVDLDLPAEDIHLSGFPGAGLLRRNFAGFVPKPTEGRGPQAMELIQRVTLVEENADRTPGLDILNRAGTVRITSPR